MRIPSAYLLLSHLLWIVMRLLGSIDIVPSWIYFIFPSDHHPFLCRARLGIERELSNNTPCNTPKGTWIGMLSCRKFVRKRYASKSVFMYHYQHNTSSSSQEGMLEIRTDIYEIGFTIWFRGAFNNNHQVRQGSNNPRVIDWHLPEYQVSIK